MKNTSSLTFLSFPLSEETPGYAGKPGFRRKSLKCLKSGDSCNQEEWQINNHIGTHIDCPFHFSKSGDKLTDVPPEFWFFTKPCLLDIKVNPGSLIKLNNWQEDIPTDCDILFLRTGFESYRGQADYWENNPGLDPALCTWLRKNRPHLRVIGFDFISITSFQHREAGKLAHQLLLGEGSGTPIWAIEDMKLAHLKGSLMEVTVLPILVDQADGAPVSILARESL